MMAMLPKNGAMRFLWIVAWFFGLTVVEAAEPEIRIQFRKLAGSAAEGAAIELAPAGSFADRWMTCPTLLKDGNRYRLWFSSFYDTLHEPGGIGEAESDDGVVWRRANKPALTLGPAGSLDAGQVLAPEVLRDGDRWLMWYTGMPNEGRTSGIGYYRVFLATSKDGHEWHRANNGMPVLDVGPRDSPDEVQAATPSILKTETGYRMWYAAWSPRWNHTICVANSSDGVQWRRENEGQPVRGLSPPIAFGHAVTRYGDDLLMLYMVLKSKPGLYAARSRDGIEWTMISNDPVITPGVAGSFDDTIVGHPCWLRDGERWLIAYGTHQRGPGKIQNWKARIGFAEARIQK